MVLKGFDILGLFRIVFLQLLKLVLFGCFFVFFEVFLERVFWWGFIASIGVWFFSSTS